MTILLAGHAIDLSCGVRYGIIGEPVPDEEPARRTRATGAAQKSRPRRASSSRRWRRPFLVFRDKVQEELKLSDEQNKSC